jgi:hypothetical protein
MNDGTLRVEWVDGGREPRNPPDPRYPEGIDIDASMPDLPSCETALPYPAKRCGHFIVSCQTCGLKALVTTAGRIDDPRSLKITCRLRGRGKAN